MSDFKNDLFGSSHFALQGKQSVRATFKLSQKAIDSIGLVAIHMGIKQKSLFDYIIEDAVALDDIAKSIRIKHFKKIPRVQKTYVISRKTIDALETISKEYDTPRDALVEYSIQKLESIIETERLRHFERKKLQKEVYSHFNDGIKLLDKANSLLGGSDPFCKELKKMLLYYEKTKEDLDQFLERSKILEDY